MNVYSVRYRRDALSRREYRMTVHAASADEARAKAAVRDPGFLNTVEVKHRGSVAEGTFSSPRCRFCKRSDVIAEGLYTRVNFPDGIGLVCDICREKADEPDDYATWQDTEIEVA
jgi:hypothetical protein